MKSKMNPAFRKVHDRLNRHPGEPATIRRSPRKPGFDLAQPRKGMPHVGGLLQRPPSRARGFGQISTPREIGNYSSFPRPSLKACPTWVGCFSAHRRSLGGFGRISTSREIGDYPAFPRASLKACPTWVGCFSAHRRGLGVSDETQHLGKSATIRRSLGQA